MTADHLWLDGDPTDGRTVRAPQPAALPPEPLGFRFRSAPPASPPPPPPRRRRGRFATAIAGGAAGAALMTGGLFGLGVLDAGGAPSAAPAPQAAAPGSASARTRGDVGAIYAAASPAVVSVRTGGGSGTGFVVDRDGTIATNAHVVGSASRVQVRFEGRDEAVPATVRGTDTSSDLAVLDVGAQAVDGVRPLALADSDGVEVGDLAVAIGSPFGLAQTATAGIVSGLEREIQAPDGFQIDRVIQTDAPINPGNSGGPLLDARGRVIGVNSQILTGGGQGNVGIGFAVPANAVQEVLPRLERGETVERPYLGVSTAAGAGGVVVQSAAPGGPAAAAGVQQGDVVVAVGGTAVDQPDEVADAIRDRSPGDRLELTLRRGGAERTVTVELETRPAQTAQPSQPTQPSQP